MVSTSSGLFDQDGALGRVAHGALDLFVPGVADEQDLRRPALANRIASRCTLVTSGQVASIACRSRSAAACTTAGETPCALKTTCEPVGHLVDLVDEDRALLLERRDDVDVVHDLLAHVHRRAVVLERLLDGDDRAVDSGAVSAGGGEQHPLRRRRPGCRVAGYARAGIRGISRLTRAARS